jgi:hypothetical protein
MKPVNRLHMWHERINTGMSKLHQRMLLEKLASECQNGSNKGLVRSSTVFNS